MSKLGLLNFESNDEYIAKQEAEKARRREQQRMLEIETALAGHIRKAWDAAKTSKQDVEQRLLDCMRRTQGKYDSDKLQAIQQSGGSALFMMLTATKVRAAYSWVCDIILPDGEKSWGLEPTPLADLPPEMMMQISQDISAYLMQTIQQGQPIDQSVIDQMKRKATDLVKKQVGEKAAEAAEAMEALIEDQLAEGRWEASIKEFIHDFSQFPTAFVKGPILRKRATLQWQAGWKPVKGYEIRTEFDRVSPFDIYPSPDASDINDGAYIFHRVRFTRSDLTRLIGVDGYDDESVREVLRDYGQGGLREWLWNDSERARLEGREHEMLSKPETIDGLHYWGSAQGTQLLQWGVDPSEVQDPLAEYEIDAILIGRHCIRCVINDDPLERRPFGMASFQPVPGSFWGIAIPELMKDVQDVCNATARSLVNNLSVSSGPQVDVAVNRLAPGEDANDIYPWKIWRTKTDNVSGSGNNPALRFFQPASNASELLSVYNTFEQKADDATNIPRYAYGNEKVGGAGNTASGLSMLMESANKGIKAAIGHIDTGVIRPMIEAMWLHNMLYSDDPAVKGDCKAVPRGSSAMLQRERTNSMRQRLFETVVNPEIVQQALGVKGQVELLRSVISSAGINGLVPEGVEDQIEQQSQQQSPEQQLAVQELQAKVQKLSAEAQRITAAAEKEQAETQVIPVETQKLLAEIQKLYSEIQNNAQPQTAIPAAIERPKTFSGSSPQRNAGMEEPRQAIGLQAPAGHGIASQGPRSSSDTQNTGGVGLYS